MKSLAASRVPCARLLVLTQWHSLINSPLSALDVAARHNADHIANLMGYGLSNESNNCYVNPFLQLIFYVLLFRMLILTSESDTGVVCQCRTISLYMAQ
jgi:ubiquitin C-terminal hydrolase